MSSVANDPCLLRFRDDARKYCEFIERLTDGKPPMFYTQLLALLSNLAASGVAIPFDMPEDDDLEDLELTKDERSAISRDISEAVFAETNLLVSQYADDEDDSDLTRAVMFWDDLSDIYFELKQGLRLFESGSPDGQSEAIWQWRFGYEHHWGNHLFRALTTAHEIRFSLYFE